MWLLLGESVCSVVLYAKQLVASQAAVSSYFVGWVVGLVLEAVTAIVWAITDVSPIFPCIV
jgi:hypothetical protein